MTSAVVGPSGGMVKSSDGALQVVIPAAALSSRRDGHNRAHAAARQRVNR